MIVLLIVGIVILFIYLGSSNNDPVITQKPMTLEGFTTDGSIEARIYVKIADMNISGWDIRKGDAYLYIISDTYDFNPSEFILMRWLKLWNEPIFDFKFYKNNNYFVTDTGALVISMGPYKNCANWNNFEQRTKANGIVVLHFFKDAFEAGTMVPNESLEDPKNLLAIKLATN